jgi:hypothetical protein
MLNIMVVFFLILELFLIMTYILDFLHLYLNLPVVFVLQE